MNPKLSKKLTLSRETVRELTDSQLQFAAGGSSDDGCPLSHLGCGQSQPTQLCNTFNNCHHC
jgi:hypothetical protein